MKKLLPQALLCLVCTQAVQAQISFTNKVSDLTDATMYSGGPNAVQDANGDKLDDIIVLDAARNLKLEYQGRNGIWSSLNVGNTSNTNAWSMVVGDVTNNGFADVLSGGNFDGVRYAKANANGTTYTQSTLAGYNLFLQGSNLADIDNDGDLDYFGCADTDVSGIWQNDGSGNFTYTGTAMIDMTPLQGDGSGNYGSTWTDFDDDGDIDLYISKCRQNVNDPTDHRRINVLYENDGSNNYTENGAAYGLRIGAQSWTSDFQDIDNDGDFDIFMTNHDVAPMLLENQNGQFVDIYANSGISNMIGFPLQGIMRDFDNDGFVDIIVTGNGHRFYHNNGDRTFTQVNGLFESNLHSFAIGDLNHDGFLDIYGSYGTSYTTPSSTPNALWANDGNANNWIAFDMVGTVSNRSAVGAKVKLYGTWGVQVREVRTGESYGIVNTLTQHFGIGQATDIDYAVVTFPSGITHTIMNPEPNQFITVIEDECVMQNVFVTSNGPTVLCEGQTLTLNAPEGQNYSYSWSTGAIGQNITIDTEDTYMVTVTDNTSGCFATSAAIHVQVAPDETPNITASGELKFCEGESVTLTSDPALGYTWSNGGQAQSIEVTQGGSYSVTIQGACESFMSQTLLVEVLAAPAPSVAETEVWIPVAGTADLSATGDALVWYDAATGGTVLGTGAAFTTPTVTETTSFYVEQTVTYGGDTFYGGKVSNSPSTGQTHNSTGFYLMFDAAEPFIIRSVKTYANGAGDRDIYLQTADGQTLQSGTYNIPNGESRVQLDWTVQPGTGYRMRVSSNNHGLWRDGVGTTLNFPYDLGGLGAITGANTGTPEYYYYFYDWEVESEERICTSARTEVTVNVGVVGMDDNALASASIFPNPSNGLFDVVVPQEVGNGIILRMMDVSGSVVLHRSLNAGRHSIDASGLAKGVYMLELQTSDAVRTTRVVLQ
ncbi:MAG: FG-GAP-like repeat-containing protein [Flavobacteriales bacterium]|nr:FG-GAP-like repeat-containing protein [Flavobacteriales bacterium]